VRTSRHDLGQLRRLSRAALVACLAAPAAQASITGVCPDGSIFIVQQVEAIPCADAKRVEPGDVPPLKPELLPRPYAWEVFNQQQNPNNPYNLIDAARQVRATRDAAAPGAAPPRAEVAPLPELASAAPPAETGPPSLGLSEQELRDLALIVELSQQRAPAAFARGDDAAPTLAVRVAPSAAFEARLRDAWARRGRALAGPVLLFSARATAPETFHPNFTFVQGNQAFHPDPGDPAQLALLHGGAGELAPDSDVLGYVVLPAHVELARPLEIYWDDRRLTATLRP
jgi:hypothetical protein